MSRKKNEAHRVCGECIHESACFYAGGGCGSLTNTDATHCVDFSSVSDYLADYAQIFGYKKDGGWISVIEKMPDDFVSVIGRMTDAGPFPSVRECYKDGDVFFFPALSEIHPVDYWMPMPEPPRVET